MLLRDASESSETRRNSRSRMLRNTDNTLLQINNINFSIFVNQNPIPTSALRRERLVRIIAPSIRTDVQERGFQVSRTGEMSFYLGLSELELDS